MLGPVPELALAPVTAAILNAGNALVTRRWLSRSRGGHLFARLGRGELPLSHATLDEFTPDRSVEHLRSLLVAGGALEAGDEWLDCLEHELNELASTGIAASADRKIALSWMRWQALPRLRRRLEAGRSSTHCGANLRAQFRQIVAFLSHLHHAELTLSTCRQAEIDTWFAQPGSQPRRVRPFLTWAVEHRHLPGGVLPPEPRGMATGPTDIEGRWAIARRLVHDPTLSADDRIAGALVVLYAQPVSRVAALTSTDLHRHEDHVTISISGVDLELPEPFADHAAQLPRRRRRGVGDQLPSPWLFPSSRPDRHVSPGTLSARLRRLGIETRTARRAAISQLASELPPALLAQSIGVSPATAARWAGLTGGNWSSYADRPN